MLWWILLGSCIVAGIILSIVQGDKDAFIVSGLLCVVLGFTGLLISSGVWSSSTPEKNPSSWEKISSREYSFSDPHVALLSASEFDLRIVVVDVKDSGTTKTYKAGDLSVSISPDAPTASKEKWLVITKYSPKSTFWAWTVISRQDVASIVIK